MPKKHSPAYAHSKPSQVHPSLQSSRPPPPPGPAEPQSVNARIQQLRREHAPRASPGQREELSPGVSRTVPPELRRILHMAEVDAPKPKAGTRTRRAPGAARPPPGPAAPTSWLHQTRHAPAHARSGRPRCSVGRDPPRFSTLARATHAELKRLPPPPSLVHQCLRTFALHWEALVEYEQHYITSLPMPLKEALLSYLAVSPAHACLDFTSFKILFQNEEGMGPAWDETRFLDLTALLNEHLALSDVGKCLKRPTAHPLPHVATLSIAEGRPGKAEDKAAAEIADSWEEELEAPSPPPPILTAHLLTPHFTNLSRLSLAHPGRAASWPDLLRISPNLSSITHLSLAHWPRPSATPNANTTSMVSKHTSVALGGSHFYSDLDEDWHEAANILRRLSIHTYSLQWLDLEGCFWLPALTWQIGGQSLSSTPISTGGADEQETWDLRTTLPGPDWNDAWRRISYLNVFQGWIPCDNPSLQNMPAGIVPVQLMRWLRENKDKEDVRWRLNKGETGYAVQEWVSREKVARIVAAEIQAVRRKGEGLWCGVDFGWGVERGEERK